jgi:hypothetical protein
VNNKLFDYSMLPDDKECDIFEFNGTLSINEAIFSEV